MGHAARKGKGVIMTNSVISSFVVRLISSQGCAPREVTVTASSARKAVATALRGADRNWSAARREDGRPVVFRVSPGEAARRRRAGILSGWKAADAAATATLHRLAEADGADFAGVPAMCSALSEGERLRREVAEAFAPALPEDIERAIMARVPRPGQGRARLRARLCLVAGAMTALDELAGLTPRVLDLADAAEAALGRLVSARLMGEAKAKAEAREAREAARRMAAATARRAAFEADAAERRGLARAAEAAALAAEDDAIASVLADFFGV